MAKRRLRKWLIIFGTPLALFLLIVLLSDTAWVKRRLLAAADKALRAELGLSISAGDSTLRLTRLAATLRDVRVTQAAPGRGPLRAVTASEVFINLAWSTVLTGNLRVQEIRVVRPRLEARLPGDDTTAPSPAAPGAEPIAPPGPAPPAKPFFFTIEKFALIDGAVTLGGTGQPLALSLEGISLDLRLLDPGPDHRAALRARGGRFALHGQPLDIRSLEADLVLDAERVDIERFLLATTLSRLEISGRVGDYLSSPSFDAALSAALSLEEASALLPSLPPLRGSLAVEGAFNGTPETATASANLRSDDLVLEGYPEAALSLSAETDLRSLTLKELTLESSGARLEARGLLRPAADGDSRLDLSWDSLDLSLLPSFVAGFPLLDSFSSGKSTASWRQARLDSLRASGQASFRSSLVPEITAPATRSEAAALTESPGLAEPSAPATPSERPEPEPRRPLPLDGDLAFAASRDGLDVSRADLRADGNELSLSGRMGWDGALRAKFEASLPDLAAAARTAAVIAGPVEDLPAIRGRARLEGTISGTTAAPALRAEVAAGELNWEGLAVDSLEASFSLDGPAVDITRLKAELAAGTVEGRFSIRPAPAKAPGSPGLVFEAAASSSDLDLAILAPFLPGASPSGRISFEAEGHGPLERPAFSVRLDGRHVGLAGTLTPVLALSAGSDGALARAKLAAGRSPGAPGAPEAPTALVVEAELPLTPPYPLKGTVRTEGLIIEDLLTGETGPPRPPSDTRTLAPPPVALTAEGEFFVPLEELADSTFALSFKGLDIGGLAALAGSPLPPNAGGQADLSVRASGDPTRPAALTVEGELGRLAFSGDLPPLESRGPVRFSLRDGVFELEDLALGLGDSLLRVSGSARDLAAQPELEVRASLDLDASIVPPGLVNGSVGGRLKLDVSVDGPVRAPVVRGQGGLVSGFFQPRDFPLVLSDLALRLELRDRAVLVTDGKGQANGGLLELAGRVDLGQGPGAVRAAFEAGLEGFRMNYPPGLITLSDGKARLEGDGRAWLLSGNLRVLQGSFREDIFPGAELFGISSLPLLPEAEAPSAAARDFKLDIAAATVEPIMVRNNMADFALEANIRVTGTLAAPLLTGRVRNVSVGDIVFGERRYTLETLRLEFLGQPVPDPRIEVLAHTRMLHRMEDLEIQLRLSGLASDLKFNLTSTPPRSSQDLSLLLLTGRSLDEVRGSALDTLKGQMILHFTSPLLSPVTRSLERFLGLDDISFVPMSIASEEDPGARLTFVKNLSDQLALTYSVDVSQTERQSWIMDYSLSRKFAIRAYKKDDGSYGGSFRHTVPLGAEKDARAGEREILAGVEVEVEGAGEGDEKGAGGNEAGAAGGGAGGGGDGGGGGVRLDRRLLEKAWKPLRIGRPFRVSDLGRATENLDRLYRKNGFANAAVTPVVRRSGGSAADGAGREDRAAGGTPRGATAGGAGEERGGESEERGGARVTVVFRIDPGEPAVFDFRGDRLARKLRKRVLAAWTGKLPESANLATARETIRSELERKRYFRAEVAAEALPGPDGGAKVYAIEAVKNGRYAVRRFEVEGNAAVADEVIRKAASDFALAESRGLWNLVHTRRLALRSVKRAYEERGYTKAAIEVKRLEEDRAARAVDIVLGVEEGPRSVVRRVAFEGRAAVEERELAAALALAEGRAFDPAKVAEDRTALLNLYRGKGYQGVEVEAEVNAAEIEGGAVSGAGGGAGEGEAMGGDAGVALVYKIKEGPLHTVSSVEVSGQRRTGERFIRGASGLKAGRPLTSEGLAMAQKRIYDTRLFRSVNIGSEPEGAPGKVDGQVMERVSLEVRETPPVTLSYGLRYNSEEKLEGFGEIDLRSPFGEGLAGLLAFRRNARQSDLRFSVESNYLFGVRFNLLSTVYAKRDVRELFTADETGLTLQSRFELPSKLNLSALYRMNRIHQYDPEAPGSAIEDKVFVSEIAGLLLRDTRDDLLDPKRGSFLSVTATWSPEFLGTQLSYVSVFGQYQSYRRFGPGLVWAAAGRAGVADAFGRELVAAKRFFAGGGNSVRGFTQDGVGPFDPLLGVPAGGQVVVVVNQELRFPIFGPASGAVFYDAGAVYPTLRDVRLGDVRHGMGLGLRMRSPVGLVRADYGFNLRPRPGEKRSVFYLSIGQAF